MVRSDIWEKIIIAVYSLKHITVFEAEVFQMGKWKCKICGYVYDEEKGESLKDTPEGTLFNDLSEDWTCPVCLSRKGLFEEV